MINKKIYIRLSKFAIATMIASSFNVAVYAKDGDLWKANSNLGGIDNVLLHNRSAVFDLLRNTSTYGYEVSNKLYNADQVNKLFIENPTETIATIQAFVLTTLTSISPAVTALNSADDKDSMQTAIETFLSLTNYNELVDGRKTSVALDMFDNRPTGGFTTIDNAKLMFNEIVHSRIVIQNSLNIMNGNVEPTDITFLTMVIEDLNNVTTYTKQTGLNISFIKLNLENIVDGYNLQLTTNQKQEVCHSVWSGGPYTSFTNVILKIQEVAEQYQSVI
ncbi:MAG: hypothetical protein ACI8WT_000741 [Clostridium sp.]|jgi:hypothetical protein